ncbi:C4-dicarboxylate transporter [Haemophilus influenzae]|uniref:C4-dicarboxylate transporter n=1 Tax=Haemophilus influenzae TaxID=727 RepID=A0A2X1PWI2_HAEIF|nr:C4-dicarboxylate transporter [Haemophilus influenzae]
MILIWYILLTKPLSGLKFFLIPIATVITFFINIAIPSAAGCAAAVGATLIPVLKSAGVRPATAGAAILAGTFGSMMSPGSSHSAMISEMSGLTITQVNLSHAPYNMIAGAIGAVVLTILALVFKDYGEQHRKAYLAEQKESEIKVIEGRQCTLCPCTINTISYFSDWWNIITTSARS